MKTIIYNKIIARNIECLKDDLLNKQPKESI